MAGVPPRTVSRVLRRHRVAYLRECDPMTGEVIRSSKATAVRYEREQPGELVHMDVKKLGKIPDGGGWRYVGRVQGGRNRSATAARTGTPRSAHREPLLGTTYLHTVIDDHSRIAYAEICGNETAVTAIGVLRRATAWFADHGVVVQRVLSDNGSAYKSHAWQTACDELGITAKKTRPYRPQTNGKICEDLAWRCTGPV